MAASNEWWDYHLTPRGWKGGSEKIDFGGVTERPVPSDRVKTVRYHEYMSSGYSNLESWVSVTYRSDDEERRKSLEEKFGEVPPKHQNEDRR